MAVEPTAWTHVVFPLLSNSDLDKTPDVSGDCLHARGLLPHQRGPLHPIHQSLAAHTGHDFKSPCFIFCRKPQPHLPRTPYPGLPESGEGLGASAGSIRHTPGSNLQGVEGEGWIGACRARVQGLRVGFHHSYRDCIKQHLWPVVMAPQRALAQEV